KVYKNDRNINKNNNNEKIKIIVIKTSQTSMLYILIVSNINGNKNLINKLNAFALKATTHIYPKVKNQDEKKLTYLPNPKKLNANAPPETGKRSTKAP